jgi:hypothetical protein
MPSVLPVLAAFTEDSGLDFVWNRSWEKSLSHPGEPGPREASVADSHAKLALPGRVLSTRGGGRGMMKMMKLSVRGSLARWLG